MQVVAHQPQDGGLALAGAVHGIVEVQGLAGGPVELADHQIGFALPAGHVDCVPFGAVEAAQGPEGLAQDVGVVPGFDRQDAQFVADDRAVADAAGGGFEQLPPGVGHAIAVVQLHAVLENPHRRGIGCALRDQPRAAGSGRGAGGAGRRWRRPVEGTARGGGQMSEA